MRILQISTSDGAGGAQRVAWTLHEGYRARGHDAWLAVGRKESDDAHVIEIPCVPEKAPWAAPVTMLRKAIAPLARRNRHAKRVRFYLNSFAQGRSELERNLGLEVFRYPGSRRLLDLPPMRPEIVHAHNLHGDYFDLTYLPELSRRVPTVLTLHDSWLLSGHCGHSFACQRWRTGCGHCPDLTIPPAIPRDMTAFNWQRKRKIYAKSVLHVATPSRALMAKVDQSILRRGIRSARVIPYGIDLTDFQPGDKRGARAALGLPPHVPILLASAVGMRYNPWKDWKTLYAAIKQWAARNSDSRLVLVVLGDQAPTETIHSTEIRLVGLVNEPATVAQYYQAADIYVHAAHSDTFPNTVLEAMACGVPTIATAVGGIPEQMVDGVTGYLVPMQNAEAFVMRIEQLLKDAPLKEKMGAAAADTARTRYDLNRQVNEYLDWFMEIKTRTHKRTPHERNRIG